MRYRNGRNRVLLGAVFACAVSAGYLGGELAAEAECDYDICHEYTEYGFINDGRLWCAKLGSFGAYGTWYCHVSSCLGGLIWLSPYKHEEKWCDPTCVLLCSSQTGFNQEARFCYGCETLFENLDTYYCDQGH